MSRITSTVLKRLGGFGSSTLANGLVGLVTIPFIVTLAGPLIWGGIAVAQSIAGMAAVLVAFGWGVMGPARTASSPVQERGQQYADSLVLRLVLLILVLPVAACLIVVWAPGNAVADVCAGAAMITAAMGGSWFYVGEGKAWSLFLIDTVPRCCGTLLGTVLLGMTGEVVYFACAQLAGTVVAASVAAVDILRRHSNYRFRHSILAKHQIQSFREQVPGVLTATASTLFMNAPLAILAGWAPTAVPVYAMADKITRFAVTVMSPMTQIAQSSVPSPSVEQQTRNIILATKVSSVGAVVAGAALTAAMPIGSQILSAGNIEVPVIVSSAFGLTLAAIVFLEISGLVSLMALGRAKAVAASASLGLFMALPLVFSFASIWGSGGAAWGLAVSQLAVALFQFVVLKQALRNRVASGRLQQSDPNIQTEGADLRN